MVVSSEEIAPQKVFNPNEHIMQIGTGKFAKDYLPVQWRLVWFRGVCPHGSIETEMVHLDLDRDVEAEASEWNEERHCSEKYIKHAKGLAIFRAVVQDGQGGVATGTKQENAAAFSDFIEKAETGAIGRALAALGYGTQFTDDMDEKKRLADAPAERRPRQEEGKITFSQISSIKNLSKILDKPEPDGLTNLSEQRAKEIMVVLGRELNEKKQRDKQAAS